MNYFILKAAIGFLCRNHFSPVVINVEHHQPSFPPLVDACLSARIFLFSLAPDTKRSMTAIQDLFEERSSGRKSNRALAGELL